MKNSFLRKIITILSLVMLLTLVAVAFSGCGENAGSEDDYESSADKDEAEAIAVLEGHFEALEKGDYEMLLEVLPPDVIFTDDAYYGNLLLEDYVETEEMRQTAITSFREYRDYFASLYGDDFEIDYEIEKTKVYTSEHISELADNGTFDAEVTDTNGLRYGDGSEIFMMYSNFYYSPVFHEIESMQEIRLFAGTIAIEGELGESDAISLNACVIKYEDQWYCVGHDIWYFMGEHFQSHPSELDFIPYVEAYFDDAQEWAAVIYQ